MKTSKAALLTALLGIAIVGFIVGGMALVVKLVETINFKTF